MPRLLLLAALAGATAVLAACSGGEAVDPNDLPYNDPYASWQDIARVTEAVVLDPMAPGTQEAVEVEIANEGPQELTLQSVALAGWSDPAWAFDAPSAPATLAAGESVTLTLTFTAPFGRVAHGSLDIRSDDPDEPDIAVPLTGEGTTDAPSARLQPLALDFGWAIFDSEQRATITVANVGQAPLTVTGASLEQSETQGAFGLSCPGLPMQDPANAPPFCPTWDADVLAELQANPIPAGGSATLEIAWLPANQAGNAATLTVTTDDPLRPELQAQIVGNGDGLGGCTPPGITLVSPQAPLHMPTGSGALLDPSVLVTDFDQPVTGMFVELYLDGLLIEDEQALPDGTATFDINVDTAEEPEVPEGVFTAVLVARDSCGLEARTSFVTSIGEIFFGIDSDGDGWSVEAGDCDDSDPDLYPGNLELADNVDQDCDGVVDEGTAHWDNDCDGYCADDDTCLGQADDPACTGLAAEPYGDCDERLSDGNTDGEPDGRSFHPGATELANFIDDDCDGEVDEGAPSSDGDGDGFSTLQGDCDDADDGTFPGAVEVCDEADNDCAGGVDDDCVEPTSPPRAIGALHLDRPVANLGVQVEVTVETLGGDGDLTYTWQTDRGEYLGETTGPTVTWQSPANTADNAGLPGSFASVWVTVEDAQGRTAQAFGNIELAVGLSTAGGSGCSGGSAATLPLLLCGLFLRRRE
jgi:hypothetical protein